MTEKIPDSKIEQAKYILKQLGMPKQQQNDRCGWVLLALAQVPPAGSWKLAKNPLLRTVDIMDYISDFYDMTYKPNSRETIRRQTLHQFEQARIVDRNRDDPSRPTNSGHTNYSLTDDMLSILHSFPNHGWEKCIKEYHDNIGKLRELYERKRDLVKVPIKLPDGKTILFSSGKHNVLQADIIHEFCPRFIGGNGDLLYIGDTAEKILILEQEKLIKIGIPPMSHEKLPDIVVYDETRNWLFLIEAVTTHGPVSPKRWEELEFMLTDSFAERIYISAFPDRDIFRKYLSEIAWETEVWISNNPDHMIHFNGDKFLGPYKNN